MPSPTDQQTNQKKRILIVEDEPALRSAISEKFTQVGYEVLKAADGEEGLQIAMAEHLHAILLDLQMPKVDGLEMLRRYRLQTVGLKTPYILILTNQEDTSSIARAMGYEVYDYMVKADHSLDQVVQQVQKHLPW